MNLEILEDFFFWSMIVNTAVYVVSALAAIGIKGLLCVVMKKAFGYDEHESLKAVQRYLANYKLLITVFNFTPWVVILIIK